METFDTINILIDDGNNEKIEKVITEIIRNLKNTYEISRNITIDQFARRYFHDP